MIRILSIYARTFGHFFLMVALFFHQLQAMPDQPLFGSSWKLRENQMVKVGREFLDEIPPHEIKRIKDEIIFNPSVLLEKKGNLYWKYMYEVSDSQSLELFSEKTLNTKLAQINNGICLENKGNSVGMLTECCGGFNPCSLSRLDDISQARKRFEEKVVSELENQLNVEANRDGGGITLVDVGSGGLFQDLILITKLFEKNKKGISLNIVFIDTEYKNYIKSMNNVKKDRKREEFYFVENNIQMMDFYRIYYVEADIQRRHAGFVQLFQWIEQAYPQHKLKMFVYDSVDMYVADLVQKPYLQANIYMGVDLDKNYGIVEYLERAEGDESKDKDGSEAYLSGSLKKILKPYGVGLMLTKECFDGKKYIFNEGPIVRNHCIKILPADASRPDNARLINSNRPMIYERYVVLAETYDLPWMSIHYWIWFFGKYLSKTKLNIF